MTANRDTSLDLVSKEQHNLWDAPGFSSGNSVVQPSCRWETILEIDFQLIWWYIAARFSTTEWNHLMVATRSWTYWCQDFLQESSLKSVHRSDWFFPCYVTSVHCGTTNTPSLHYFLVHISSFICDLGQLFLLFWHKPTIYILPVWYIALGAILYVL